MIKLEIEAFANLFLLKIEAFLNRFLWEPLATETSRCLEMLQYDIEALDPSLYIHQDNAAPQTANNQFFKKIPISNEKQACRAF